MREQLEDLGVYPSCRANRQRNKEGKKEEARNEDMEDAKKENEAEKVQKAEETKKEDVKLEVSPAVGILPRELPTEMREQLEDAGLYPKHRQGILKKGKAVEKNTVKNGVEKEEVNVEMACALNDASDVIAGRTHPLDGVAVTVDAAAPSSI
ncbi:hypothetical protein PRIPAC_91497 [Pristionchus pacificus]|uniref:Uncharacterized protein n=1 Tax=Pristionchus pacificus TaxID=54126 RepID=A0A2A6CEC4_PRIPA|nr:hypothetical protein PRIPAC_91497 [Pristionchus pacificus]|eukprot:PDM76456.1 hypothetical protein PRIPAC_40060 [Pristionchus pacificus]